DPRYGKGRHHGLLFARANRRKNSDEIEEIMSELQKTFSIIKPDAIASGKAGEILSLLEDNGFRVVALRMTKLSQSQAEGFYAVHRERPFFGSLVKFMTEGPV